MSLAGSLARDAVRPSPEERARESDIASSIEHAVRFEIARELHDRVAPTLAVLLLQMEKFKSREPVLTAAHAEVADYQSSVRLALRNIRDVLDGLRDTSSGLRTDLVDLLRETAATMSARAGMSVDVSPSRRWPATVSTGTAAQIQRIVQEALTNTALHSEASHVDIRMSVDAKANGILQIDDNGKGSDRYQARRSHYGLVGMRERAATLGGELTVERGVRGGTTVRLTIPLENLR